MSSAQGFIEYDEIPDGLIAVRASNYFTNLYHAAWSDSASDDGTYRALCGGNSRLMRPDPVAGGPEFDKVHHSMMCLKCLDLINPPPPPKPKLVKPKKVNKTVSRKVETVKLADVFDYNRFMDEVEAYRKRNGMTVMDLARVAGLYSSHIRRGKRPVLSTTLALAEACDLSIDTYRISGWRNPQ